MIRSFKVKTTPTGKGRPKFVKKTGHTYTPKKTIDAEKEVKEAYRSIYGEEKYKSDTPLDMYIFAKFRIPKSDSETKKKKKLAGKLFPTIRPDIDNIGKLVLDALNGVAYEDDKQVVRLTIMKLYNVEEGLEIIISDRWGRYAEV